MFDWIKKYWADVKWTTRQDSSTDPDFISLNEMGQYPAASYSSANGVGAAYAAINLVNSGVLASSFGVERNKIRVEDHPLSELFEQPYSHLDGHLGWEYPIRQLLTNGNGYFIVERGRNNRPVELIPAVEGGARYVGSGSVEYSLTPISYSHNSNIRNLLDTQVVAFHWHGFDGLTSPSPIAYAARSALTLMRNSLSQIDRAVRRARYSGPAIEIASDSNSMPTPEQIESVVKILRDDFTKVAHQNKAAVLPPGAKGTMIPSLSEGDLQLVDILRWGVEDIARIWNMAPSRLGQLSGGGAGVRTQTFIDQMADFEVFTISPVCRRIDAALNRVLLIDSDRRDGYRIKTDTSALRMGSFADLVNTMEKAVARAMLMTPNEGRARMGLPARPDGDQLLQPKGAPAQNTGDDDGDDGDE